MRKIQHRSLRADENHQSQPRPPQQFFTGAVAIPGSGASANVFHHGVAGRRVMADIIRRRPPQNLGRISFGGARLGAKIPRQRFRQTNGQCLGHIRTVARRGDESSPQTFQRVPKILGQRRFKGHFPARFSFASILQSVPTPAIVPRPHTQWNDNPHRSKKSHACRRWL